MYNPSITYFIMKTRLKIVAVILLAFLTFATSTNGQMYAKSKVKQKQPEELTTRDYLLNPKQYVGKMKIISLYPNSNKQPEFKFHEAIREGQYVKVTFRITNTIDINRLIDKRPSADNRNLCFKVYTNGDFECEARSKEKDPKFGGYKKYPIGKISPQGKAGNAASFIYNLAPQKFIDISLYLSFVPINATEIPQLFIRFRDAIGTNPKEEEFSKSCYVIENLPIKQFILNEHGISRLDNHGTSKLDCTVPISKLPKSYKGLYSKIRIESVCNEMDGYTETYVDFINDKNEIMMTGISYEEGDGKRLNQLIIKSNMIHTPEGIYVGIPYKEVIKKGGNFYRQWWEERIKLNNIWFNIEGLNATGEKDFKYLTILHEQKMNDKGDYITKGGFKEHHFQPNAKVSEFTYDLITNR